MADIPSDVLVKLLRDVVGVYSERGTQAVPDVYARLAAKAYAAGAEDLAAQRALNDELRAQLRRLHATPELRRREDHR